MLRIRVGLVVGLVGVGESDEIDPRVVTTDSVLMIIELCGISEGARTLEVDVRLADDSMVSDTLV